MYAVLYDFAKCRDSRIKSALQVPKIEGQGFSQFGQCPYLDFFFLMASKGQGDIKLSDFTRVQEKMIYVTKGRRINRK